MVGGWSLGST